MDAVIVYGHLRIDVISVLDPADGCIVLFRDLDLRKVCVIQGFNGKIQVSIWVER